MTEPDYRDPETLRELYHGHGLSLEEVGNELGCSETTVLTWMDKHEIGRRDPSSAVKHDLDIDEIERLYYDEEQTAAEIANQMGCQKDTILYRMEKNGLERREPHKSQEVDIDPDDIWEFYWNRELALDEAAEELGVTSPTLRKEIEKHNIPKWKRRFTAPSKETLHELYWVEKETTKDIAERFNVSAKVVERWFESEGVELRSKSERMMLANPGDPTFTTHHSYERITYCYGGETHIIPVHRLACAAWYGLDAIRDKVIHHKNEIPWDNREENLEPVTREEHNQIHVEKGGVNHGKC